MRLRNTSRPVQQHGCDGDEEQVRIDGPAKRRSTKQEPEQNDDQPGQGFSRRQEPR